MTNTQVDVARAVRDEVYARCDAVWTATDTFGMESLPADLAAELTDATNAYYALDNAMLRENAAVTYGKGWMQDAEW